jgi:hypothetical protein
MTATYIRAGPRILRRCTPVAAILLCLIFVASSQSARNASSTAVCGVKTYSYAGIQAANTAEGVSASVAATTAPVVEDGHVGAWIGLGGTHAGPGRTAEWIQVGLAAFTSDQTESYYEIALAGLPTKFTELDSNVAPGVSQHFAVLEMVHRRSWWRVWVNGKAVTSPIHLPGSDNTWYPQAVAESLDGATGACNSYSYSFSAVSLAEATGSVWTWSPVRHGFVFQDAGYRVTPISTSPRSFLAASLIG